MWCGVARGFLCLDVSGKMEGTLPYLILHYILKEDKNLFCMFS